MPWEDTNTQPIDSKDWQPVLEAGKKQGRVSLRARGNTALLTAWFQISSPQNSERTNVCCFVTPTLWCFFAAALGNGYILHLCFCSHHFLLTSWPLFSHSLFCLLAPSPPPINMSSVAHRKNIPFWPSVLPELPPIFTSPSYLNLSKE